MKFYNKMLVPFARRYKLFTVALIPALVALALDIIGQDTAVRWILAVTALLLAIPLMRGMYDDFRSGKYDIGILAVTAIVTAVILREYWAAMVVVLMLTGGKALEDYAEHRSKAELDALLMRAPQKAHLIRGKKTIDVPVSQIRVGDRMIIKAGETVPVDATVIEGSASFNESSLTGESVAETKDIGAKLMSGSVNTDGTVTAKATQTAASSQYQQIIRLVKSAASSQAPFVRLADRYSIPFIIFAFALAGSVWAISGDPVRFLEVIVVATPGPLILAAPIAVISGMSRSAKQGLIVRTGSALERLAEVKTIAFVKTGTLTIGKPVVADIITHGTYTRTEVLAYAAALESASTHTLAIAINQAALSKKSKIPKAHHVRETTGHGLSAMVGGRKILVGRIGLLQKHGVSFPKKYRAQAIKQTATYVAIDGQLAGTITFTDEVRPESRTTLNRLRKLGIRHFVMVTGDNKDSALKVAQELGITDVRAEALPAAKLRAVESVPDKPVAFVGDGVHDASVLTAADVGIALGARGSTAASESADLIIMHDDVGRVATGVEIARRTFRIAKQSVFVGMGLSVLLMFIFATGKFTAIYGAAIQEFVNIIAIFSALRAHSAGKS